MDIYIARQPIFDRRLNIYGYELLYRNNEQNFFVKMDDDQATAELIHNAFLVVGLSDLTDGTKAFINFSKELIDSDVPFLLPKNDIVIEILEREETTKETIEACKRIKDKGYTLAIDDFVFDNKFLSLIEVADIIKVEFNEVSYEQQKQLIETYGSKVKFLAEKVETREQYQMALDIGYDYFQGYFFCKPVIINSKEIGFLNISIFEMLEELNSSDVEYTKIANIIERDLGLSYKILKLANSVHFSSKNVIKSIHEALVHLGVKEIYQWVSLMMLKDLQSIENAELIKLSMIRGKFMDLIANELYLSCQSSEYFFVGTFSSIDIILNKSMDELVKGLPFTQKVKDALNGNDNELRRVLECVLDVETANWDKLKNSFTIRNIGQKRFINLYLEAIKWAKKLSY